MRVRQTNMITILDNSEQPVISDEDFSATIDEALKVMDYNNDGYISFIEYVQADIIRKQAVAAALVVPDPEPVSADAVAPEAAVNFAPDAVPAPQAAPAPEPAVVPT